MDHDIPFNRPHLTHRELGYIAHAHALGKLSGDGPYTRRCHEWLERSFGIRKALLTHSCTAALEMVALLANIEPGDEVIMPSYTFVSTANAFVLRGGVPVFVDVRGDTFNIDETKIEAAITSKTRAIVAVHYAGVGCEMDRILEIARRHDLEVFEDAAQGICAKYRGQWLGTFGSLATFSFHETKNLIAGEGGALAVNAEHYVERAEIIREKGTNRNQFFRGQVDKYTWVDIGSSYLPGEIIGAFLMAQLEQSEAINAQRFHAWTYYHQALEGAESKGVLRRPVIPAYCDHNAHMYYVVLRSLEERTRLIEHLRANSILAVFHYVPLHDSPAGRRFGRAVGAMDNTQVAGDRLLRLPLFVDITRAEQERVVEAIERFYA